MSGVLADALRALPPHDPVIDVDDRWDAPVRAEARAACADRGVPLLRVRSAPGRVVVGPAELPGTPGCADCAELRHRLARRDPEAYQAIRRRHGGGSPAPLDPLAADLIVTLVADEVARLTTAPETARTRCATLSVDLRSLRVTTNGFLPDPSCRHCGGLPPDSPAAARIELRPRPKAAPDRYRLRSPADDMPGLVRTYVDAGSGLVRGLSRDSEHGVVIAAAPVGLREGGVEYGYGRTESYRDSELTAILEALERYGGMRPGGRRTVVRATYADVAGDAVDPRTLGTHPDECYRLPGFRFRPFAEDRRYSWVWAHSFARGTPVLVPESYAYYRLPPDAAAGDPFVYEVSNGCALGSCLEEAILYGLLEVAERDAFLMTWYARLPVPRIDLDSAADRTVPMIAAAIRAGTGYDILVFDTTLDHGVPCVWAMAVDAGPGDAGTDRPRVVCAAGSHLDPERAAANALRELGPILGHAVRSYPRERHRARAMVDDPTLVAAMSDHSLLYGDPAAFDRFDFLTAAPPVRSFAEAAGTGEFANDDLSADLAHLLRHYRDSGLDVIVVDQTTDEHRAGGFACVKVIVPGLLPMTFGHRYRRVDGLPRLHTVPARLGYRDRPLRPAEVNPHPHPFP